MDLIVVIPAYNEEKTIGAVVAKCKMQNAKCKIIVINDGSIDRTAEIARQAGAIVLSHPINRGLGAALATGIEAALQSLNQESGIRNQGVIVTLDADGQHNPADIPRVIEPIVRGEADVVIGTRFNRRDNTKCPVGHLVLSRNIPLSRLVANWCGNLFTWLLFDIWASDSQSGLRAFSTDAARQLRLRTSTMEVSSEIIREIARLKLRLAEVPITVQYTDYSLSKGQGFFRGLETLWKLIVLKFFR